MISKTERERERKHPTFTAEITTFFPALSARNVAYVCSIGIEYSIIQIAQIPHTHFANMNLFRIFRRPASCSQFLFHLLLFCLKYITIYNGETRGWQRLRMRNGNDRSHGNSFFPRLGCKIMMWKENERVWHVFFTVLQLKFCSYFNEKSSKMWRFFFFFLHQLSVYVW